MSHEYREFLIKHKDAEEIITDLEGEVLYAAYRHLKDRDGNLHPIKTVYVKP